jgi:hypothetical protein
MGGAEQPARPVDADVSAGRHAGFVGVDHAPPHADRRARYLDVSGDVGPHDRSHTVGCQEQRALDLGPVA